MKKNGKARSLTIAQLEKWLVQKKSQRWLQRCITAELASAIAGRCKATGVRQSLRTYAANYETVLRLAQPQVMHRYKNSMFNP
jgi:hypothetical protein